MTDTDPADTALDRKELAARAIRIMADGTPADFEAVVHPEALNREADREPAAARGRGPAAFHATAQWLRAAYGELAWEIHDVVADGDLVVLHTTMSGRQTGTFVVFDDDARPLHAFPPTGRRFAATQTHWLRFADGMVVEHWANRDDLGQAAQLGWNPPSPWYVLRTVLASRRARRDAAPS